LLLIHFLAYHTHAKRMVLVGLSTTCPSWRRSIWHKGCCQRSM